MRTKTLLLTAAALLAAGFVSSQAQPVYSQNIVGYASVATPVGASYYLLTVPFAIGSSNGANEVFGTSLPNGTAILTWNVGSQSYVSTIYDASQPNPSFPTTLWYQSDDYTPATIPTLPVGRGFFMNPTAAVTNTFAGTVAVNVGTSNAMQIPTAATYYLLASVVPYAGAATNGSNSTGGANLNGLPNGSVVLIWNAATQSYVSYIYDASQPNPSFPNALWYQSDDYTPTAAPSLSVGQGFFLNPTGPYTWTTGL